MRHPITENDVRLIPYSPAYERDALEIRVQVRGTADGQTVVPLMLDGEPLATLQGTVTQGEYSLLTYRLPLTGRAGYHTLHVGEADVPLTVLGEDPLPLLDGGMLMLGPPNDRDGCDFYREASKSYTDAQWKQYVTEMAKIGMSCIVVMVSHQYLTLEHRDIAAHYPSKLYPKSDLAAEDALAAVLQAAGECGMQVFLGLGNMYGHRATEKDAEELFARYRNYPAFYGWYLAEEFGMNKEDLHRWERYKEIIPTLRRLSPAMPVLVSPYCSPCEEFGEYLKTDADVDIIMPQDQCGSSWASLTAIEKQFRDLQKVCRAAGKHAWANCESFDWIGNLQATSFNGQGKYLTARYLGGGIEGPNGFDKQLRTVRPFVEKISTFMLNGFFAPPALKPICGGAPALKQYLDYRAYREKVMK